MKLEVGMYVRTNKGIFQIRNKDVFIEDKKQYIGVNGRYTCIDIETILKASHNIIDLIQENDFVNGHRVSQVDRESLELDIENSMYGCGCETINGDRDIKTVLTKEQMEAMQYKVVE